MDKKDLIQKIKNTDSLTNEEKSSLIELLYHNKKYGLVWEEKPEAVEELLRTQLPVLQEVTEKRILAKDLPREEDPDTKQSVLFDEKEFKSADNQHQNKTTAPNHIIIEGDNLHALTALSFTHKGKIDVIYIDPPYNTGNKDFKYNDNYIDKDDTFRHSKWLSFMQKRLSIAYSLLNKNGIIFINIDDNEQAQLKLLCDELFGESNYVNNIVWQSRTSISNDDFISTNHNHTHIYAKDISDVVFNGEVIDHSEYINPDNDARGPWKLVPIDANKPGGDTYYPIKNPKTGKEYYPPKKRIWAINQATFLTLLNDGRIKFGINDDSAPKKKLFLNERLIKGDSKTPSSILLDAGTTKDGTNELIAIFGVKKFDYPKPSSLIKRFLNYTTQNKKDAIVLDFFAGSGTTLHATMQLNAEDGGNRQCILVTNNENNICEEVTYERNSRVIKGYTNLKGEHVAGLTNNNLRYYKCEFVPSSGTEINRRLLTRTSTEMLQIKEDCYTDITNANSFNKNECCICTNENGKYLLIVYHSRRQHEVIDKLCEFIQQINDLNEKVKIYAFSPEADVLLQDFFSVADKIEAVPLPDAIYNAYRATFKTIKLDKKLSNSSPENPPEAQNSESDEMQTNNEMVEEVKEGSDL